MPTTPSVLFVLFVLHEERRQVADVSRPHAEGRWRQVWLGVELMERATVHPTPVASSSNAPPR